MDGPVLGGGVIILVAVLLWMLYLLPTWQARHRFDAAERNAVRLNQALRVLAETSETPGEVTLELNTRTVAKQQKLARKVQAQREQAELVELKHSLLVAKNAPDARRARARRRARLCATVLLIIGIALIGGGVWQTISSGAQVMLWSGASISAVALLVLQRMAAVVNRAARRAADTAAAEAGAQLMPVREAQEFQDVELARTRTEWTPRPLPKPLVAAEGSRAAAELDAAAARDALRQAARAEAMRERAERLRPDPTPITAARAVMATDAEIEAHVRELLRRRAVGE